MPRVALPLLFASFALTAATSLGCATYRQDLDRARHHYEDNQYEAALALFRVLEPDLDSLSPAEQTQYAYLRGMTDYRLASIAQPGSNVKDPKQDFRNNARHWLSVAAAIEKQSPGGMADEEKQRLTDAMTDLNHDVYGGADTAEEASTATPATKPKKPPAEKPEPTP
jgi:hypothetical protein